MHITIIGAGYVGLVSGACFADLGWRVTCVDIDEQRIARLRAGDVPIFEPGLEEVIARNAEAGRLTFETELEPAVGDADAVFIAVGTPPMEDGRADTTAVAKASVEVAKALNGYTVVVIKSTVPVGTGPYIERLIRQANPAADFSVTSNPGIPARGQCHSRLHGT